MALEKAAVKNAINRIQELCHEFPDGVSDKIIQERMASIALDVRVEALNVLLKKAMLKVFKLNDYSLAYKMQSKEEADKQKGLHPKDILVYQVIQRSKNDGIWVRDIRRETNLQQTQITEAIKALVHRTLIKEVQCVDNKSRKVYMLAELQPSEKVTGGAFYSGREFDAEFVNVLKQLCQRHVMDKGVATLDQVINYVNKSGIAKEELDKKGFKQILDVLVLDGSIEEVYSTGVGPFSSIPVNTACYRVSKNMVPETSAVTNIPCGVCPVLRACTDDGLISPKTCVYFQEWLNF